MLSGKILALSVDVKEKYEGIIQKALHDETSTKVIYRIIQDCKLQWKKEDGKIDGMTLEEIKAKLSDIEK